MKQVADSLYTNPYRQDDFFDHFHELDVTSRWTDTSGDSGAAPSLLVAGVSSVALTAGTTANNEICLSSKRFWDVLAARPLIWECRDQYAEAATNANAILKGLFSAPTSADRLVDTTSALASSFSGIYFYKPTGSLLWNVGCSVAATRYGANVTSIQTTGSTYASFRFEVRPISSVEAEIVYLIDPNGGSDFHVCRDNSTGAPIKHILTYTSFAPASCAFYMKNIAGTTEEVLNVDSVRVSQVM